MDFVGHAVGRAIFTAVLEHGLQVALIDEEAIGGTRVAAPGSDGARKEA